MEKNNEIIIIMVSILIIAPQLPYYYYVYATVNINNNNPARDLFNCTMWLKGMHPYTDKPILALLCYEVWKTEGKYLHLMSENEIIKLSEEVENVVRGTGYDYKFN